MNAKPLTIALLAALGAGACCWQAAPRQKSPHRDEAIELAGKLARSVASCADKSRGRLPPTARVMPEAAGKPEDWSDEAYKCGGFSVSGPERWQVQWVNTGARQGLARVAGDFDGNGTPELIIEHDVSCSGERCMAAPYEREGVLDGGR